MDFTDPKRVYGWIAVSLSLTYKFPQIYKIYNSGGDVRGISVTSQLIQVVSYCFYIVHGIVIQDGPVTLLGFSSLLQSMVLVSQYFYYWHYGPYGKLLVAQASKGAVLPGVEGDDADVEPGNVLKRKNAANT